MGGPCPVMRERFEYRKMWGSRLPALQALLLVLAFAVAAMAGVAGAGAATLDDIRARGQLVCGASGSSPGFSLVDGRGNWTGLDVDFCSALAAAILGSKSAVKFVALGPTDRYAALKNGSVDVLSDAANWTFSRDTDLGFRYAGVLFHDGQGFLVRRGEAVSSVLELSGSTICVLSGTNAEQALGDYFKSHQMKFQPVVADRWPDLVKAYEGGSCVLLTGDASLLALERSRMKRPGDHMMLAEFITREPLGPMVRKGDDQWFDIVRWTLMALVAAEDFGITAANVDTMRDTGGLEARRLLGAADNLGQSLGLPADWAARAIKQVGNYGEMFERNVGSRSALNMERGPNALWSRGGLMYAAPFR